MQNAHASETPANDLRIEPAYESLVPKMLEADFNQLKESIRVSGQLEPIIANRDLVVLDGHHRYQACKELGITPRYEVRSFASREDEMAFAIRVNLVRRHLKPFQRIELAFKLEGIESEKAHMRRTGALKKGRERPLGQISPNGETGRVSARCAEIAGVSPTTYKKAREIAQLGPEELKLQLYSGQLSIDGAYRKMTAMQTNDRLEQSIRADDEQLVGVEDEFEVHILTKEECREIAVTGAKMSFQDRCHVAFDHDGRLLDIRIAAGDGEELEDRPDAL